MEKGLWFMVRPLVEQILRGTGQGVRHLRGWWCISRGDLALFQRLGQAITFQLGLHQKEPQLEGMVGYLAAFMTAAFALLEEEVALLHARLDLVEKRGEIGGRLSKEEAEMKRAYERLVAKRLLARERAGLEPVLDSQFADLLRPPRKGGMKGEESPAAMPVGNKQ